jgi:multidrug efflux pump
MSVFFINRPIFAWVVSIVIMLAGLLAVSNLAISQYPEISPPTVRIHATYPGADAQTVENSVTKVIEQGMTGIDNLDYMSSTSTSTGSGDLTLTFKSGTDADIAQMQVQNKLQLVTSQLPKIVQTNGVTVTKSSSGFLMVLGFVSTDGKLTAVDLADYVDSNLNDTLKRVEGVGETQLFGSKYAMRVWLDPLKLTKYSLNPSDVEAAIQAQNNQVSAGQLGALPAKSGQQLNVTVTARSRLQTPDQFRAIIVKSNVDGSMVRLSDVATVEIGNESYNTTSTYNGKPAAGLAINLATGANAISTAQAVRDAVSKLESTLPEGVEVIFPYDTSPFVKLSIEEVGKTLAEAIVLVFIVMFVFLQNFRATLIPTLAVPVVLLGTFGILALFGYSINTLTMFAMVLAIGLLVDDAIVVVENVERVMEEEGLPPKEATVKSMKEITGALIGIATVLSAVFIPMAFFGGSVGVIYRQFAVTIVSAMVLSVVVAIVFTPALSATLLKQPKHHGQRKGFFGLFNRTFAKTSSAYTTGTSFVLNRTKSAFAAFLIICGAMGYLFTTLPGSFLPEEDQGILITIVQLPVGATQTRTQAVLTQVKDHYLNNEKDAVDGVFAVGGFGFGGQGQNVGLVFTRLKNFEERKSPAVSAAAVAGRAFGAFSQIKDAMVIPIAPPAIQGLGNSNGFSFYLKDVGGQGHEALIAARNELLGKAAQNPMLAGVRPNGQEDNPQFKVAIDQEKASALGVSLADIDNTLSTAWGSSYVNDFIDRGRIKPVYMQGDEGSRMQASDLDKWHVRNASGVMVPFSSFAHGEWTYGSPRLERFNGASALEIQGGAAPGISSGDAMDQIDQIVKALPNGFSHEWTGLSYQEKLSGNQAFALYAISMLVVFLALAALYESWTIPFAVMLTVPVGIFGALAAATIFGQANDVYFKVGLLTTIGLAAKNAILIVEFAKERLASGQGLVNATLDAARQRLRPILMTSFAFILGVLPLAISNGAGSGAQNSIGIGVMGGMIAATALGVFFAPLLFVLVQRVFTRKADIALEDMPDHTSTATH